MYTNLLFSKTVLYILARHACLSANVSNQEIFETPDKDDPKEFLYRHLSTDAYFTLPCHEENNTAPSRRQRVLRDEISFDVEANVRPDEIDWEFTHAEPAVFPPGEVVDRDRYNRDQSIKNLNTMHDDALVLFHLCYSVSYMWRRGRKGIHRYYNLRDTYTEHMPFEIGYITQVIMTKYQNVLELYDLSTKMEGPDNLIGRPHLYFFYKNILEDCRTIIHLCNMIHEVTRKYRLMQRSGINQQWADVHYEASHKFQEKSGRFYRIRHKTDFPYYERDEERGIEGLEHEKFRHESNPDIFKAIKKTGEMSEKEKQRLYQKAKPNRQHFLDHGHFTMTNTPADRKTKRWRPQNKNPLDYGWSGENK